MSDTATRKPPVILGLLPFGGVVLFVVAEIVVLLAGGASDFLYWTTMNAVLFLVGSSALGSGIAHVFFGPVVARSIGWEPGPFQFEVGAANLGIGVAAIVTAAALPPQAWLGAILVALVFLVLAGVGHIRDIVTRRNFSINNAGPILFLDFLAPIATLVLWFLLVLR